MCGRLLFPPVFGYIFKFEKCVLSREHEQGFGSMTKMIEGIRNFSYERRQAFEIALTGAT